jgi:two-component system sensor histidine kinase ChvG
MRRIRRAWTAFRSLTARIAIRLLAFNLLLVFLPAAGLLYLNTYERHLLEAQERGMVQQARIVAAAAASQPAPDGAALDVLFERIEDRGDARIRVIDRDGHVIADSNHIPVSRRRPPPPGASSSVVKSRESWLYRIGARLYGVIHLLIEKGAAYRPYGGAAREPASWLDAPEVQSALAGRYGAVTRVSVGGQRSVTLYGAVPVSQGDRVTGVVLVSQSTYRLLQALYDVRLRIFAVVVWSAAAAALLSLLVSATIVRPLRRLRRDAGAVVARRGGIARRFEGARRRDEIGDLARALEGVTQRLEDHVHFVESFAADLSHEFKNPLASVRTVAETLEQAEDPDQRHRFLEMLKRDVQRLDRLLAGVNDIVYLEGRLERESSAWLPLAPLVRSVVEGTRLRAGHTVTIELDVEESPAVRGTREHLERVMDNLLDNAVSFSPPGGRVEVVTRYAGGWCEIAIRDHGPGIPDEHRRRVFDRFFSYRPGQQASRYQHAGLGLPIVRTIVEAYGGSIDLDNAEGGGTCARVRLPARTTGQAG